jgi:histidinol-phosphatase
MRHFRSLGLRVETKPDMSPVSNADRETEAALRSGIAAARPGDAVVGEEMGAAGGGPRRWILDPIDGTRNYVRGLPVFATLVALEVDGELAVGVVSAPALGARWWARRGSGAFSRDGRLEVSAVASLADATVGHAHLDTWRDRGRTDSLLALVDASYQARGVGDFWQHMLVAQGGLDAAVEPQVALWDLAALQVIVEEAGGRFTDLAGARGAAGGDVLSSNGRVHDEVLGVVGRDSSRRRPG